MEPLIGMVLPMAFNFAPRGWSSCEGQLIAIQSNTALFSLLGTMYGGNGTTTFGLPDLRGRAIVGQGSMPGGHVYTTGQVGGAKSVTLTVNQIPPHTHGITVKANQIESNSNDPQNNFLGGGAGNNYTATAGDVTMNVNAAKTALTGGNQPLTILDPYLCVQYNIATQGYFPSRN